MTSSTPQLSELRTRPTAALVRAAVIGGGALALALLLGRPEIILAGLPMLIWALVALARRLQRGEERTVVDPAQRVNRCSIEEGGTAAVTVRTSPGTLTAATLPMPRAADVAPRHGSLAGDGEVRLRVTAHRWGRIRVGPMHVLVADALGAYRAQRTLPRAEVQVVPASTVLDAPVEVPTPVGVSGVHLSRRRGDGTALSEVRAFRPGDRLHRINWRVTSRTGELHTNATFTEQDTDVLIVTDTIADVAPAPWVEADAPTSLDMTVRATSAIARHYLTAGDRVSVFDIGHLIGAVPPGSGPRQLRGAHRGPVPRRTGRRRLPCAPSPAHGASGHAHGGVHAAAQQGHHHPDRGARLPRRRRDRGRHPAAEHRGRLRAARDTDAGGRSGLRPVLARGLGDASPAAREDGAGAA